MIWEKYSLSVHLDPSGANSNSCSVLRASVFEQELQQWFLYGFQVSHIEMFQGVQAAFTEPGLHTVKDSASSSRGF